MYKVNLKVYFIVLKGNLSSTFAPSFDAAGATRKEQWVTVVQCC